MNSLFRTAHGRVDFGRPLEFTFNGKRLQGYWGDTLASALLANGVRLVGRSFKYHRPRGIYSAGSEEPSALVQLGLDERSEPNIRATQIELFDGLVARSVNAWPSVEYDLGAANEIVSSLLVAGFYYKTFMHPKSWWMKFYEPAIRRMAGHGRVPVGRDPDIYDKMHVHCDVLVVGGGPAGLMAALSAARTGARVIVVDEQSEVGGSLLSDHVQFSEMSGLEWISAAVSELRGNSARILSRTTAVGYYDQNCVVLVERRNDHVAVPPRGQSRQRLWKVYAKRIVLATGAHERPLVFPDNDRPGVMLAGAARTYVTRYGVLPGRQAVVFTNNDTAYDVALDLAKAGIEVKGVVDLRELPGAQLSDRARTAGIPIFAGSAVLGTSGRKQITSVEIAKVNAEGDRVVGSSQRISCDLLAISGGWNPAVHLFSQSRGVLNFDDVQACFVPGRSAQFERSAGACRGTFDLAAALREGAEFGTSAALDAGFESEKLGEPPRVSKQQTSQIFPVWTVPLGPKGKGRKAFVDLQNDVTADDIQLAAREGYTSIEHVKRYTTVGMGTDQGKTSNVNALAILAGALRTPIAGVGTTTFRPPYTPVAFGALAGRDVGVLADPARVTSMHRWHVEQKATFESVGQWLRPHFFPRNGESMHDAVGRECRAVRTAVGLLDASTLGKIDIQGRDASIFLNRIYTNAWSKLDIGRCRYGLMCADDGMVMDDGVTTRLGPTHYLMTTTTSNAAKVLDWLEEWLQTEWPDLRVYMTSVTDHWATAALSGPRAREVLGKVTEGIDLDTKAFPFMSMKVGTVAGVTARVFRISFTGELSYEVNVPAQYGLHVWTALMEAGAAYGIAPFGTEAQHVLRAEKGYIVVGQETDGTVTPLDLGMSWIVSKQKSDFIGRRSLNRTDTKREDRKRLVGLLTDDPTEVLPEGAQVTSSREASKPSTGLPVPSYAIPGASMLQLAAERHGVSIGHVTSSYFSGTLGRSIALALVGQKHQGANGKVIVPVNGRPVACTVVDPIFYDQEGKRLHA